MTQEPRCVVDCKAILGEGAVWVASEQALYWLDIKGRRIFRRRFEDGEVTSWETPFRIGSLAPRAAGGFVSGTDHGLAFVDPAAGRFEPFAHPEPDRPTNRFNDGKLDRQGRFWAGTMDDEEKKASGALYRIDPNLEWSRIDDGYRVTNGPAFSPDGRILYHTDSAPRNIYAFDLDPSGAVGERRLLVRFGEEDGHPDGMTVDAEGCLWVAFWDGWCVRRISPQGEVLRRIEMPVQRPTSCAFGGPDLDHLFITSARIDLDENHLAMQPYAGGLFVVTAGTRGVADTPFAG